MELPKFNKPEGGMLSGIKSKLGFADAPAADYDDGYYDDYNEGYDEFKDYGDGYDEYADYGTGYDDRGVAPAASQYDPYAPVTTRPAGRSRAAHAPYSGSSRGDAGMPKLVSIDDVRAHTQIPDSLNRDPLPPRRVSSVSAYRGERTVVDDTKPAPSSPAHVAQMAEQEARRERSEGLNSLFSSTTDSIPAVQRTSAGSTASSAYAAGSVPPATASGAYGAFTASSATAQPAASTAVATSAARAISVLKPSSYSEVERIASALKGGDAVILALRNTPDQLSKRILDFSFGVASALDARVEAVSDKVFAITRGAALSEAEKLALRNQGVL